MRCRCCNNQFEPRENKITGLPEDLCSDCLLISRYAALGIDDEDTNDIEMSLNYLDMDID